MDLVGNIAGMTFSPDQPLTEAGLDSIGTQHTIPKTITKHEQFSQLQRWCSLLVACE